MDAQDSTVRISSGLIQASEDLDRMWAAVDRALEEVDGETLASRPRFGLTIPELAKHMGSTVEAAEKKARRMHRGGKLRKYWVRLPDVRGHLVRTVVYVPVGVGDDACDKEVLP